MPPHSTRRLHQHRRIRQHKPTERYPAALLLRLLEVPTHDDVVDVEGAENLRLVEGGALRVLDLLPAALRAEDVLRVLVPIPPGPRDSVQRSP